MGETIISRNDVRVTIGPSRPTVIIGERINPTGKEWLKQAIRDGHWDRVGALAREQVAAGAVVIDVNVAVSGANEVDALPRAVEAVQKAVPVPLCLDSGNAEALAAALRVCDGTVIINSRGRQRGQAGGHPAPRPRPQVRRHRPDDGPRVRHPPDGCADGWRSPGGLRMPSWRRA